MGPFEPARSQDDNEPLYCSAPQAPDDIIWEGSDTEQTPSQIHDKRLRYEKHARRYLQGHLPVLQSTRLRGPFDEGWTNPWRQPPRQTLEEWWQPGSDDMLFTRPNVRRWAASRGLEDLHPVDMLARCRAAADAEARALETNRKPPVPLKDRSQSTSDLGYQSDSSDDPLSQNNSIIRPESRARFPRSSTSHSSAASRDGSYEHKDGRKSATDERRVSKRKANHQWLKGSTTSKRARYDSPAPTSPSPMRDLESRQSRQWTQKSVRDQIQTNLELKATVTPDNTGIQTDMLQLEGTGEELDELNDIGGAAIFLSADKAAQSRRSTSSSDDNLSRASSLALKQTILTSPVDTREGSTSSGSKETSRLPDTSRLSVDHDSSNFEVAEGDSFVTEVAPSSGNASEFIYKKKRTRGKRKQKSAHPILHVHGQDANPSEPPVEATPTELDEKLIEDQNAVLENPLNTEGHQNIHENDEFKNPPKMEIPKDTHKDSELENPLGTKEDTMEIRKTPPVGELRPATASPNAHLADEAKSPSPASNREASPVAAMPSTEIHLSPANSLEPRECSPDTIIVDSDSMYPSTSELQLAQMLPAGVANIERELTPLSYDFQPGESSPGTIVVDTERASYLVELPPAEDSPMEYMAGTDTESLASDSQDNLDSDESDDITPLSESPLRESPSLRSPLKLENIKLPTSSSQHHLDFDELDDISSPPESPRSEIPSLPPLPKPELIMEQQQPTKVPAAAHGETLYPTSDQESNSQPSLSSQQSSHYITDNGAQQDSHSDATEDIIESQIRSEMNVSTQALSPYNPETEGRYQLSQESRPEMGELLVQLQKSGETSQTPARDMYKLLDQDRAAVEEHKAAEEGEPASHASTGSRQEQDSRQERQLQSPWATGDIRLPPPVDLRVTGEHGSAQSSNGETLREEGVIPDSDRQSPERPKTPQDDGIVPFKEFMSPSPSPSRSRTRLSLGRFPSTQVLVDAATRNPWAKDSEPRRKKKVSFGLPDDEQPESASSIGEAPKSPPPPQKTNLPSQADVFDDGTTVVNAFQKHFAAAGQRPIDNAGPRILAISPSVGAMAEAFIAADRQTSDERGRLASGEESPTRHLQPMRQATASTSADGDKDRDAASPHSSPFARGNAGLDDVDLDEFLGEAGGFLEEWSVETELRKKTTTTDTTTDGLSRPGHGSDARRLLFGEMW